MKQLFVLVLLAIFAFIPQVSAQELPSLPTPFDSTEQNEVVYTDEGGNIYGLVISSPKEGQVAYTVQESTGIPHISLVNNTAINYTYYKYQLVNGNWSAITSNLVYGYSGDAIAVNGLEFISSTYDIKNQATGELVFPLPEEGLHLLPGKLMEANKEEMTTKILAAMKIILLCGVGCLVLLISLPILSKVLRKFQAK